MDIKDIKKVVDLMTQNDLTEFSLEDSGFKLALKRGAKEVFISGAPAAMPMVAPAVAPVAAAPVAAPAAEPVQEVSGKEVKSPIVGTFYSKPSPDASDFVKVGDKVTADTVICIVEAMKVLNEIKAEVSGTVKKVLKSNGEPIQYGEPMFIID